MAFSFSEGFTSEEDPHGKFAPLGMSPYYRFPKLWGEKPEEGSRYYNDPKEKGGIISPWLRGKHASPDAKLGTQNNINADGSPDARRESTWLGVAAKAALLAGMAAPFIGPAIRGGMALGGGVQGAYAAGGMKGIGQTIAGAGRFQAGRAADAGRAAMADPRAAMAAAGQGIVGGAGRLGRTYRDFYAGGGAGRELNRARNYFGM